MIGQACPIQRGSTSSLDSHVSNLPNAAPAIGLRAIEKWFGTRDQPVHATLPHCL